MEQFDKFLLNKELQNSAPWNWLFIRVPRKKQTPKPDFMGFHEVWGWFLELFTSYSQEGLLSLAMRREISNSPKKEQEKSRGKLNFYFLKRLDAPSVPFHCKPSCCAAFYKKITRFVSCARFGGCGNLFR
ncbi:MAG: hypothetical protein NTZ46_07065 [Verrucomicrobia bacterium]|nr:hypothetical protein [Verrucomicrobiota bacterium]